MKHSTAQKLCRYSTFVKPGMFNLCNVTFAELPFVVVIDVGLYSAVSLHCVDSNRGSSKRGNA